MCGMTHTFIHKVFLRERSNVILFPGVLETLDNLKRRGFKLGAITNGNADMSKVVCVCVCVFVCVRERARTRMRDERERE